MNIDQRLEALTHAVEMLVQRQNSHDDNLDRLFDMQAETAAAKKSRFSLSLRSIQRSIHLNTSYQQILSVAS